MDERPHSFDDYFNNVIRRKITQIPDLFEDYETRLNSKWTIARRSHCYKILHRFSHPHSPVCLTPGRKYINFISQLTNLPIDETVDSTDSISMESDNSTPLLTVQPLV